MKQLLFHFLQRNRQ
uniref:Uncharacterized protein n=1 Tax=Arundo donax TaxID=35708 RepID=A0A0A8ZE51_ARUDO